MNPDHSTRKVNQPDLSLTPEQVLDYIDFAGLRRSLNYDFKTINQVVRLLDSQFGEIEFERAYGGLCSSEVRLLVACLIDRFSQGNFLVSEENFQGLIFLADMVRKDGLFDDYYKMMAGIYDLVEDSTLTHLKAWTLLELTDFYFDRGNDEYAQSHLQEAIEILRPLPKEFSIKSLPRLVTTISSCLEAQNLEVLPYLERALFILDGICEQLKTSLDPEVLDTELQRVNIRIELSQLVRLARQPEKADQFLREAEQQVCSLCAKLKDEQLLVEYYSEALITFGDLLQEDRLIMAAYESYHRAEDLLVVLEPDNDRIRVSLNIVRGKMIDMLYMNGPREKFAEIRRLEQAMQGINYDENPQVWELLE